MKKIIDLYKKNEEVINYLIFGVLTTVINLFTYYICTFTFLRGNDPIKIQIANVVAWIISVTFAYVTNRKFVFKSKNEKKLKEALSFYTSRITTLLIEIGLMFLLVTVIGFSDRIIKLIVQFIIIVLNYVFSKIIVFRKKKIKE